MAHINKLMIRWINGQSTQLEWWDEITLFTSIMHRINNTGWKMKRGWREGVERGANSNILRECWTFLTHIFLHQLRKQLSRILRFQIQEKFGDMCLVLTIRTVIPIGLCSLTFVCKNKQGNHCNWHKSLKELRLRKVQHYLSSLKEEKTLAVFDPTDIVAKKPQPLCEHKEWWNEGREKEKNPCPFAHNANV